MLQFSGLNRAALPRRARALSYRKSSRLPICRSTEQEAASSAMAIDRPSVGEDAKVKATISALDSLLGDAASTTSSSSRVASSSAASTSSSSSSSAAPRRPAAPPAAPQGPSVGDSKSDNSGPARKPAGLTFDQVMGFSGLAPEVINGRAAMIGFFLAIGHEFKTGESVFAQMVSGGAAQALIVILAVTVASFAPMIRGTPLDEVFNKAPKKVTEWGPFTAAAEGLNGRLAMIGIGLLIFFEGAGSTAFFLN